MTNSKWRHCQPEAGATGTSTKYLESSQIKCCCGAPRTYPTKPKNRENFIGNERGNCRCFWKAPSLPSAEQKVPTRLRNCHSWSSKPKSSDQNSFKGSIYSITDLTSQDSETPSKVFTCKGSETFTDNEAKENIFDSDADFINACDAVIVKCKELQENTFINCGNSKNRIYYCVLPSVFQTKPAAVQEQSKTPHKIVSERKNTQYDKNKSCNKELKFESISKSKETVPSSKQNSYLAIKVSPKLDICLQKCQTYCPSGTERQSSQLVITESLSKDKSVILQSSDQKLNEQEFNRTSDNHCENKPEEKDSLPDCCRINIEDKHSVVVYNFPSESDHDKDTTNNNLPNSSRSFKPEPDYSDPVLTQSCCDNTCKNKLTTSKSIETTLNNTQPDQKMDKYFYKKPEKENDCCKITNSTENNLPLCCTLDVQNDISKESSNIEIDDISILPKKTLSESNIFETLTPKCCKPRLHSKGSKLTLSKFNKEGFVLEQYTPSKENAEGEHRSAYKERLSVKVELRKVTDVVSSTEKVLKNINYNFNVIPPQNVFKYINKESTTFDYKKDANCSRIKTEKVLPETKNKPAVTEKPSESFDCCKPNKETLNSNKEKPELPDCCKSIKETLTSNREYKNVNKEVQNNVPIVTKEQNKSVTNSQPQVEKASASTMVDGCSFSECLSAFSQKESGKEPLANKLLDKQKSKKPDCDVCKEENEIRNPEPPKRTFCEPENCEKLNIPKTKKWKPCCDEPQCSINDPTTSTFKFLVKARLCCNRRECQLAAKICDIYEPFVNIDIDTDSLGDERYHFLGTDAETEYNLEHLLAKSGIEKEVFVESTIDIKLFDDDYETVRESVYIDPEDSKKRERRTSTVSWNVPAMEVIDVEPESSPEPEFSVSDSAEQVIAQATAEANKFRQTPQLPRQVSIFGDIIRHGAEKDMEPVELSATRMESNDVLYKSQIDGAKLSDSKHSTNCCAALKKKFKRKKKTSKNAIQDDDADRQTQTSSGRNSLEADRRRANLSTPVIEKKQQINTLLNSM